MTILETIVAFVVLALVGIACLDLSRGASQLELASADWTRAVEVGESTMARAIAGAPTDVSAFGTASANARTADDNVVVTRQPWRNGTELVDVIVTMPSGKTFRLSRVVTSDGPKSGTIATGVTP